MKIILTMQLPYIPTLGGANKCNRMVAEALVRQSHDIQVIVPATNEANGGTLIQFREYLAAQAIPLRSQSGLDIFHLNGVEIHALHESAQIRAHLIHQIKTFEPDWILVSGEEWSQVLLDAALKAAPSRVVYLAHTVLFLPFGPSAFFPSSQRTQRLEQVAGILACSQFVKDYIQQWSRLNPTTFYFPAYGSGPFPNLGCFDKGYVTLINPSAGKGISIFVELARRFPDVQFSCVPTWGTTKNDRKTLENFSNITFLGPSEDIENILTQTRVMLLPSLWPEGFPLTTLESMLRGIPVLASNAGGLPEAKLGTDFVLPITPITTFTENLDDRLIPAPLIPTQTDEDIQQWCQALMSLLSNRAVYEKESRIAREKALGFISRLSVTPLINFLNSLPLQQTRSNLHNQLHRKPENSLNLDQESHNLSDHLANLSPEQQALLSQWLQTSDSILSEDIGKTWISTSAPEPRTPPSSNSPSPSLQLSNEILVGDASTQTRSLTTIFGTNSFPLSYAQQRLWFLDQWESGSTAYLLPYAWRLKGDLDIRSLTVSFEQLMRRHEVLRTSFSLEKDEPIQIISESVSISIPIIDLSNQAESQQTAAYQDSFRKEATQPFDLQTSSQLRIRLLRLGPKDHVLLVTLHHIITDGWSMQIFWRELSALYAASRVGQEANLPALPLQYSDFATWQRQKSQEEHIQNQIQYWREKLQDLSPLSLPTDFPRPPHQTHRGTAFTFSIVPSVVQGLTALSNRYGATLFMSLLTVFKSLLHRYSRQNDIAVGLAVTDRPQTELEGLIGFFVNTLVLRTTILSSFNFEQLLIKVRKTCLEAYDHQDVPFERIVEALQPKRDTSRHPLIQTMFQVHHAEDTLPLSLPGLIIEPIDSNIQMAKFDLVMGLTIRDEAITGQITFNSDLFTSNTIEQFGRCYEHLLEAVVRNPTQQLSQISILDMAERSQLLEEWTGPVTTTSPSEGCIHQLFEAQVARTPDTIAVVFGDQHLTYALLNKRANQLAHHLQGLGIGPDVRVAVCLERNVRLLECLLAIFKAGGAYIPLDPDYPPDRITLTLEDAQMPLLVTQQSLLGTLPANVPQMVLMDTVWSRIAQQPLTAPPLHLVPENLAYMIYTSGSTGMPKGVQIPHRAFVNFLQAMIHAPGLHPSDRLLAITSLSFDIAGLELWLPLLVGAQVVLINREMSKDGDQLLRALETHEITVMQATPATWQLLIIQGWKGRRGLRVLCGGEQMPLALAQQFGNEKSHRVWNLYGPTETTIWSTRWAVPSDVARISIGRPIANTQLYVEDRGGSLVPKSVPGELFIGGEGLARGYGSRPALTAERFVPDPYSRTPGVRRYRTGDLVRYREEGHLEWMARLDQQIKLRGYRIELGEIEAALNQHPSVQDTVVVCREDRPEEKQLVAYLVGQASPGELRPYLQERLPAYMVPSAFVVLEELPLTPNGKVNRKALPAPDPKDRNQGTTNTVPTSLLEELLVEMWQEVLNIERIGIQDNFFALGGHSLLATKLISRLRQILEFSLPLRTIFEKPTIAELAQVIERELPNNLLE